MEVKQISVFLENKPGMLTEFAKILQKNDISMKALCLAETPEYGVLRIIVDDNYKIATVLKDEGYVYRVTPVLAAVIPDKPGSLVKILDVLAANDINLEYTYAFITREKDEAYIIIRVQDTEKANKVFREAGIKLLSQDEIDKM
ncbi:ACT domain-containing protein [Aminicella lysinilytica]|uniref:ACT domain-containing protein n=1 Tax=Aminicella lysinilytica TaxID=433323 RepID=A0A4R6Q9V7_9FIRM|nr:ACT domain-containing protein [Aminicella lysinilytica]NLD10993.1 acetolactate synthase [Clostridiales bacterium]TDP58513.1 hypothetical protein EV211_10622 [Aminicella lysinilytica]